MGQVKEHWARFPMSFKSTQSSLTHCFRQDSQSLVLVSCPDKWICGCSIPEHTLERGAMGNLPVLLILGDRQEKRIISYKAKIPALNTCGYLGRLSAVEDKLESCFQKRETSMMLLCAEPGVRDL